MRIKFLTNAEYPQPKADGSPDPATSKSYKAGEVYDVTDDHGNRWIRRGVAIEVADEPPPPPKKHEPKRATKSDD